LSTTPDFEQQGFVVVEDVISDAACEQLVRSLPQIATSGSRTLLALLPFRMLVQRLREDALFQYLDGLVAVECI
jgi:hypothetical protein